MGIKVNGVPVAGLGRPGVDGKDGKDGRDGKDGLNGTNGADGANGKSAYETAVSGGYTGTEAEFQALLANAIYKNGTVIDAKSARITNVTAGTANSDAATISQLEARIAALETKLSSSITTASDTATQAKNAAATAQSTASSANSLASTAKTTADNAYSLASAASTNIKASPIYIEVGPRAVMSARFAITITSAVIQLVYLNGLIFTGATCGRLQSNNTSNNGFVYSPAVSAQAGSSVNVSTISSFTFFFEGSSPYSTVTITSNYSQVAGFLIIPVA